MPYIFKEKKGNSLSDSKIASLDLISLSKRIDRKRGQSPQAVLASNLTSNYGLEPRNGSCWNNPTEAHHPFGRSNSSRIVLEYETQFLKASAAHRCGST